MGLWIGVEKMRDLVYNDDGRMITDISILMKMLVETFEDEKKE